MKIEFEYTIADYREALRAHAKPRSRVPIIGTLASLVASATCLLWTYFRPHSTHTRPLTVAGVIATTVPVSNADPFRSLIPFLPLLFMIGLVFIFARFKPKLTGRQFYRSSGKTSRMFSPAALLFLNAILAVASVVLMIGQSNDNTTSSDSSDWIGWIPWVLLTIFLWFVLRNAFKKNWKQQPGLARPKTFEYSPHSIMTGDDLISTTYRWEAILRCLESENLFLLYPSGLSFVMLPKRAFPSPEAIDGFRRLIQEWADGQSLGFPVVKLAPPEK